MYIYMYIKNNLKNKKIIQACTQTSHLFIALISTNSRHKTPNTFSKKKKIIITSLGVQNGQTSQSKVLPVHTGQIIICEIQRFQGWKTLERIRLHHAYLIVGQIQLLQTGQPIEHSSLDRGQSVLPQVQLFQLFQIRECPFLDTVYLIVMQIQDPETDQSFEICLRHPAQLIVLQKQAVQLVQTLQYTLLD